MKLDLSFSGKLRREDEVFVRESLWKFLSCCPEGSHLMGHISERTIEYSGTIFIKCGAQQWAAHSVHETVPLLIQSLEAALIDQVISPFRQAV